METFDRELDEIEIMIEQISDEDENRSFWKGELQILREKFENMRGNIDEQLKIKIARLSSRLSLYLNGIMPNNFIVEENINANLYADEEISITQKEQKDNSLSILKTYLEKGSSEEELDKRKDFIEVVESKYKELKFPSQEFEQFLVAHKYGLMNDFLLEGRVEEAKDFSKTFKEDMRLYIIRKLKDNIKVLINQGKAEEAEVLQNYIYKPNELKDEFKIWEVIMQLEHPEVQVDREDNNIHSVKENKNFFEKLKESRARKKEQKQIISEEDKARKKEENNLRKQEAKEKNVKIFVFKNNNGKVNEKEIEKLNSYINGAWKDKLVKIVFEEGITDIKCKPRNDKKKSIGYGYPQIVEVEFPSTLKSIGGEAFKNCSSLKSVDLSHTQVEEIEDSDFAECSDLREIKFSTTLKKIGRGAFLRCQNLEKIDCSETQLEEIGNTAFSNCEALKETKFSKTLKHIGNSAFYACQKLENIDISETQLEEIDYATFAGCSNLKEVKFSETLRKIGMEAFRGCENLERVDLSQTQVEEIENSAFSKCRALKEVKFAKTLKKMGEVVFFACPNLRNIDLSETQVNYNFNGNINEKNSSKLEEVEASLSNNDDLDEI